MVRRVNLAVLLVVLSVAGCESSVPTPSPAASSAASSAAAPSATAVPTDHASSSLVDPFLGSTVVTVSDNLRVRSAPGISDESRKYEPLLPLGTQLRVMGGPVSASDYVWYDVAPVGFPLLDAYNRVDHGWVAMADHDGQPWLALAAPTIAGLELATSDVARAPANAADASAAASSVSAFGLDLYREMLAEPNLHLRERNVVFSPMSIALALGMARAGAREATSSQMDTVLHTSGWDTLRSGLNSLDQALASRDGTYLDDERKPHQLALRVANASFAQQGWSIEPAYLDALASAFGAGLNLVDYAGHPEAALQTINAWVSQKTAKRIPELLQDVSSSARLYLVNAIYLKANWEVPFPTSLTAPRPFNRPDGSTVTVPTMGLGGGQEVPYVRGGGWRATQLRYLGRDRTTPLAMTLIEPDDLASFESTLNPKQLGQIVSALTRERTRLNESISSSGGVGMDCGTYPYSLNLFMPRFSIETRAELRGALSSLGMPFAFDASRADFTGIHVPQSDGDSIHIANVIHQANIDVDELGTEAAAATAVSMDTGGCTGPTPGKILTLRLDHPFLFAITDIDTGAILFLGRVVDPAAG